MIASILRDTATTGAVSLPVGFLLTSPTLQSALINLLTALLVAGTKAIVTRRRRKRAARLNLVPVHV